MFRRALISNLVKCRHKNADSFPKFLRFSSNSTLKFTPPSIKLTEMAVDMSNFILPNNQRFVELDCSEAFNNLSNTEKLYAHYLSQAAWNGGLIVLLQTSPESPKIFSLLHRILTAEPLESLKKSALAGGVTEDEFQAFLVYAGGVYANMGNYKGFGDTKFVPGLGREAFGRLVRASAAAAAGGGGAGGAGVDELWQEVAGAVYALAPRLTGLGLADKGVTTYFSCNCTAEDSARVDAWMKARRREAYNCRVFKTAADDGLPVYTIRLASAETGRKPPLTADRELYEGAYFEVVRGDYAPLLRIVIEHLAKAREYAANDNEKKMLEHYINSFREGSLDEHKEGSRYWIKDKGPIIETYQGFIETYRDPAGQRGEFEGFVAMVNKEMSKKFGRLVDGAEEFIKRLPWGAALEKDTFLRPDFTSLDVLAFAGSGLPAGINIPNYDEIRQDEGFKNVSLGNVIPAAYREAVTPFLDDADRRLLEQYRVAAFEVQVGLHELLGHGSGKLLRRAADGSFNFDKDTVVNPLTKGPIESWYAEGETYDGKFTTLGSAFEECRAEAVGLYLSLDSEILEIFGYTGEEAADVTYVNWLSLVWNGAAKATEMYQPATGTWLQAHARARFAIMRLLQLEGGGCLTVTEVGDDLLLALDRAQLHTTGKRVIGDFLVQLQTLKATGDAEGAARLFAKYSDVTAPWDRYRDIVLRHKQPRNIFVQPNTVVNADGTVSLVRYAASAEGAAAAWAARLPAASAASLSALAAADRPHFAALDRLLD